MHYKAARMLTELFVKKEKRKMRGKLFSAYHTAESNSFLHSVFHKLCVKETGEGTKGQWVCAQSASFPKIILRKASVTSIS